MGPALQHIHLKNLTPYLHASGIQSSIVERHLRHKANPNPCPPAPVLLTFQTPPTYTTGRRELAELDAGKRAFLEDNGRAEVFRALRGGQTTFHGPGQLVAYLICDLKRHQLGVHAFVRLLETSLIQTCAPHGIRGYSRDEWPGVWVDISTDGGRSERKLASVGIHIRRHISSHGIGLNVSTDLKFFEKITACGLPGNLVTNMANILPSRNEDLGDLGSLAITTPTIKRLAESFASNLAHGLLGPDGRVLEQS